MKKIVVLLALLAALLPETLAAQSKTSSPRAVLAFFDDETQLVITDPQGNPVVPVEGMAIALNTVVKTLKTTAEIQLVPNGSIIKLAASTTFAVKSLKAADGSGSNDFSLIGGKIRAVAAKLTGAASPAPSYNISTPTANCGVRGTDFAMFYDLATQKDWVCVQEGKVDFTNITTGTTIPVASSQFANTFDAVFQAGAVDSARLAQLFSDVDFVKLKPLDVPGNQVAVQPQAETTAPPTEAVQPAAAPAQGSNPWLDFLRNFLALEVGSTTINGTTYSKAVLSPVFTVDKFKLGLYLPIIYTSDLFDHNDWYRPGGNDEWSFGADQNSLGSRLGDLAADTALKIRFLEWGDQANDPFYLKLGNLKTMTLGHGSVVRNFANDQDFPAVRKIGLNAGAKLGGLTVEGLSDDLVQPQVVGGRVALDLLGDQFVLGVQATADLHLADEKTMADDPGSLNGKMPKDVGDPVLLVGGVDLQLFKIDFGPIFRTHVFTDVNALTVYNRYAIVDALVGDAGTGLQTETIWHSGKGSFGTESGVYGNVALVDYRLSFQTEQGLYRNAMFQGSYYRTRGQTLEAVYYYQLNDTFRDDVDKTVTMGIFGSAGFSLFGLVNFEGAYRWPFEYRSDGSLGPSDADYLRLALSVPKGKLPFVKLSGGVAYERSGFASALRDEVDLFDANAVFSGNIVYGLTDGLDLVLTIATSAVLDGDGNQVYTSSGIPKVAPTVSLDSRISF